MYQFKGFKNFKKINEKQFTEIYSAERDNQQVILKMLRSDQPSPEAIALMYHEYEITKDLRIPGIIQVFGLLQVQNHYALILEDIQGVSLKTKIPVDLNTFYALATQMVEILIELGQQNIIHKDIKPSNFIVRSDMQIIKLTDFNYSTKLLHEVQDLTPPDKLEGTLAYIAPEQTGRMNINIDYRCDFYALGVTFYEMLTGKLPFESNDPLELIHCHIAKEPPQPPNISKSLASIIRKLMAKNPIERYQSGIGIQADLMRSQTESELFPLAQEDIHDRLNLSEKLYGREEESKILLDAYQRASAGALEVLMVCGYSGIGKTKLINEVHRPMVEHKGYFISGKFELLQRNTPYTAITQAFNQLVKNIIEEPDDRFQKIKQEITQALGGVAQVMIDLAPNLELIIGKQPPLESLPPQETQNRMKIFFRRFVEALATKEHPLVLFIDDLQWIDSGSLNLLESLTTDVDLGYFLLIGAYRENEVNEHHPLKPFIKNLHSLTLFPLSTTHFINLFSDSFERQDIAPLAELVHKRTGGNPFFCKQVISLLYKEGLIYFNYDVRHWEWKIDEIENLKITDNVVELMVDKLKELPTETQNLLKFSACIGNRCSLSTLQLISGENAETVGKALAPAMQAELLLTLNLSYKKTEALGAAPVLAKEINYQFIHDRVRQAVYQEISKEEKERTHLKIARLLDRKEQVFEVADHFNQALRLLEGDEILEVVELNYEAAVLAQKANAYQPMFIYITTAISLMNDSWWDNKHEIIFKIYREYAQSLFLLTRYKEAEDVIKELFLRTKTTEEKVSLHVIEIQSFSTRGKVDLGLESAGRALNLLGVRINFQVTNFGMMLKFLQVWWRMRRFHVETIEKELPVLTDRKIQMAYNIFKELPRMGFAKSFQTAMNLCLVAGELILKYGKTGASGIFFVSFGYIYLNLFNNLDKARKFVALSRRLYKENPDKYYSAIASMIANFSITHLYYSPKENTTFILQAHQDAFESGNIVCVNSLIISAFDCKKLEAKSLREIKLNANAAFKFFSGPEQVSGRKRIELEICLLNDLETGELNHEDMIKEALLKANQRESNFAKALFFMDLSEFYYHMELHDRVVKMHDLWYPYNFTVRYLRGCFNAKACNALSIAKHFNRINSRFKRLMKDLKIISDQCPDNFLHHYLFLKGTAAKFEGKYKEALYCFDNAIQNAKKGDFFLYVAEGNELAADMLVGQKMPRCAESYIREAEYYYGLYGMKGKAKILRVRYSEYFKETQEQAVSASTSSTSSSLDLTSVIKASQTISGEFIPEKLFEKMLRIILENAGAKKALFIEKQGKDWIVVASLNDEFEMTQIPLKQFKDIPSAITNTVLRSHEPVVVYDARNEFMEDAYVARVQPRSVLMLPIMQYDHMVGLLYLENNLTAGSFTQERVTVLKTIAAQIAISLGNARQLEHLANLNKKTERFVPKSFLKLLHKESVEEVELGDSIRKDISILFNDIRSFTSLVESREPENAFAFIIRYWEFMAPVIREHHGYIDQYQGDAILAIFPEKPEDAVLASIDMMKQLSHFNERQKALNDVEISMGIGISTGEAMLGVIGEKERQVSGLISDVANTAARTEGLNKLYGSRILITGSTKDSLPKDHTYYLRKVDRVRLKGKAAVTEIYEVVEWESRLSGISLHDYIKLYEAAFQKYQVGEFNEAIILLRQCNTYYPADSAAKVLMDRCKIFFLEGAPKEWDGTFTLTSK